MCQLSAKNLTWNFLWNVSNFALIFYVIHALSKKSRQSLKVFPESFRWDFLLIIGTHIVKGLTKNFPLRKVWDVFLAPLTALTIKVVYLVSKSWCGKLMQPCVSETRFWIRWTNTWVELFVTTRCCKLYIKNKYTFWTSPLVSETVLPIPWTNSNFWFKICGATLTAFIPIRAASWVASRPTLTAPSTVSLISAWNVQTAQINGFLAIKIYNVI